MYRLFYVSKKIRVSFEIREKNCVILFKKIEKVNLFSSSSSNNNNVVSFEIRVSFDDDDDDNNNNNKSNYQLFISFFPCFFC